mmetsp:Transcript_27037/g.70708  ORF Transcript_27037/g.70708 Transcript_27037/m.70708 type:complete len:229 (+) Transcript_27037:472-1158(+)
MSKLSAARPKAHPTKTLAKWPARPASDRRHARRRTRSRKRRRRAGGKERRSLKQEARPLQGRPMPAGPSLRMARHRSEHHQGGILMAQLLEVWLAREIHHRRRAAHDGDGALAGREEVIPDHRLADEADVVLPLFALGRAVHRVPDPEAARVPRGEVVQLPAHQDVGGGLVRVQEPHLRRVLGVAQDSLCHLVAGREARPAGDHVDELALARRVHPRERAGPLVDELS